MTHLPPSSRLPCPGRHSCHYLEKPFAFFFSWLAPADCLRMGPFALFGTHWLRCCLGVLPQHLVPTHLSSLRVEGFCSLVCLPQWSVKGVSLLTGPSTCLLLSAHRLRDSISDNHPKLFQTDYYCCDYYYCCARTSRQQSKQVHFKANNSLVLIHKAWASPILSCD